MKRCGPERVFFLVLGFALVGLAGVGVVVPGMPTTIFLIMALWAFKRSSERMENWLLNHPVVGPTLRDWEENRWLRLRTKVIAITAILATIGVSIYFIQNVALKALVGAIGIGVSIYLWTRRTKPEPLTAKVAPRVLAER